MNIYREKQTRQGIVKMVETSSGFEVHVGPIKLFFNQKKEAEPVFCSIADWEYLPQG